MESEYLSQLQQRPKWQKSQNDLEINDIVLIKEDNLLPLKWKLGRIIAVHPGSDHTIRVVSIKTGHGVIKQPINKKLQISTIVGDFNGGQDVHRKLDDTEQQLADRFGDESKDPEDSFQETVYEFAPSTTEMTLGSDMDESNFLQENPERLGNDQENMEPEVDGRT
ncbi:uncharacterized protein LOC118203998 [Stegodyphus dumicola]|uniref:uncharacterized protein LOC118203998 n=1 Tax=Stegodyphus dumicola TaxID=202533 RepID=UPI0015B00E1F|nr:uncharacterized protein LOC118203998 [Stegodyphus dumicola]